MDLAGKLFTSSQNQETDEDVYKTEESGDEDQTQNTQKENKAAGLDLELKIKLRLELEFEHIDYQI